MYSGRFVFSQLMEFFPLPAFRRCVQRYRGQHKVQRFSCLDQFLCMAFAQLTGRESLRDIETCLRALQPKLYHVGIRANVSRTTLARANENRDWRIYADFAQVLIGHARKLYSQDDFGVQLEETAYVFDSSTIDLCLSLFPWARFRQRKAAIKLHTLMDLRGNIPCCIRITEGKTHDVNLLDDLVLEPGAFYIMDRGYLDFGRLHTFTEQAAFFVIRAKRNLAYRRRASQAVDKKTGVRSDQRIVLSGPRTSKEYPDALRRISFFDVETRKRLVFLSNQFLLPSSTIAQLYRCRWQVELFFKWIKQHLRIKAFFGTSENAVKTQIWIAVSMYVLVAIMKKQLRVERSLSEILQILTVSLFEKVDILQVLTKPHLQNEPEQVCNQLNLFDL